MVGIRKERASPRHGRCRHGSAGPGILARNRSTPAIDSGDGGADVASMSEAEWRAFLAGQARTAKLATVRRDGRPHVAPIWFALDGDEIVFTTGEDTIKGKAIQRDGRVCLCVDDER